MKLPLRELAGHQIILIPARYRDKAIGVLRLRVRQRLELRPVAADDHRVKLVCKALAPVLIPLNQTDGVLAFEHILRKMSAELAAAHDNDLHNSSCFLSLFRTPGRAGRCVRLTWPGGLRSLSQSSMWEKTTLSPSARRVR